MSPAYVSQSNYRVQPTYGRPDAVVSPCLHAPAPEGAGAPGLGLGAAVVGLGPAAMSQCDESQW